MNRAFETVKASRQIERIVNGVATSDGAGVRLTRLIGQELQQRLDPFLMLDNFGSDNPDDYIAGFPDHPHRGFETITYMLAGRMRHRDSAGHEGLLENGGVQWMTAGRGVIHSEIPEQQDGLMEGFQLWLNLPSNKKMISPWYRDIPGQEIPSYVAPDGVTVRVIAGRSNGVEGAVSREDTEPLYLDIDLPGGSAFHAILPESHNAFVCVYRGEIEIGGKRLAEKRMAVLSNEGEGVILKAGRPARAILVAGKPLNEPVVQYGPLVMNTREEIYQALSDVLDGHFAG